MKVLLTTLNAKYIHSSLALRYLGKYCRKADSETNFEIIVREFTINDHLDNITAAIYKTGADVFAFSCYIWNITKILQIAERLKKVKPGSIIILGGPEVSFASKKMMVGHSFIDYIIRGEGEESFSKLLTYITKEGHNPGEISGLVYREDEVIIDNGDLLQIGDLDTIPRPYQEEELVDLSNKIIYYETARGCPFNCSYCLSSTISGVRYFSLDRVKKDLMLFIENDVELVKFVDRTFNTSKKWAMEIFKFLVNNQRNTSFHFEIAADLFDEEMIEFLSGVPAGLFEFEIGVQSTNPEAIAAVDRKMNFKRVATNVRKLKEAGNIHLHLDLIAGLPGEDYSSVQDSFNDVYTLAPDVLQLGFLKLLKGSKIREEAQKYNYKYTSIPPYEVLENDVLSYEELLKLKGIEYVLKKYHNSGVFKKSLAYILHNHYNSSFQFFAELAYYFAEEKLNRVSHSQKALYDILYEFYRQEIEKEIEVFSQYLKFDLLLYNKGARLPEWAEETDIPLFKDKRYQFLKKEDNIRAYIPRFQGRQVRKILRQVTFAGFKINVLADNRWDDSREEMVILFDYETGSAYNVTEGFFAG